MLLKHYILLKICFPGHQEGGHYDAATQYIKNLVEKNLILSEKQFKIFFIRVWFKHHVDKKTF